MQNRIILFFRSVYFLFCFYLAKFRTLFQITESFWLVSERGCEARDNGYFFFLYMKENHPEQSIKYIISSNSNDLMKFDKYKNDLIELGSFSHYLALNKASHLISTHIMGYTPDHYAFSLLDKYFNLFKDKKKIFLQHGIIKDDIVGLYAENLHLDLFICGASEEYEFVKKNFHYDSKVLKHTGLCRFDNLNIYKTRKQILIMPTWRSYINKNKFEESEYFIKYAELLTNETFSEISFRFGYKVVFYPHYELQTCISSFKQLNLADNITIAGFEYDVQSLLKESDLLITDFSSVYFDMAYMKKYILLYQFDTSRYHYKQGYFNVENIGTVVTNLKDLLLELEVGLNNSCKMKTEHSNYVDKFFTYHDEKNCERIYEAINRM